MKTDTQTTGAGDEIFGDTLIYCNQHLKVHKTGWCSVSVRDKVGLGTKDHKEAVEKCREWGFRLHQDPPKPKPEQAVPTLVEALEYMLLIFDREMKPGTIGYAACQQARAALKNVEGEE
jgi:hypothetical protein